MNEGYTGALTAAKAELAEIQPAIDRIIARQKVLQGLVNQLEAVMEQPSFPVRQTTPSSPETPTPQAGRLTVERVEEAEPSEYLWQQIRTAMQGAQPWTLAEAGERVEQQFNLDLGPLRPQKVRNAVVRHPETFVQMPDGRWRVR